MKKAGQMREKRDTRRCREKDGKRREERLRERGNDSQAKRNRERQKREMKREGERKRHPEGG